MIEQAAGQIRKRTQEDAAWWSNWVRSVDYQWSGYRYNAPSYAKSQFGVMMVLTQNLLAVSSAIESAMKVAAVNA